MGLALVVAGLGLGFANTMASAGSAVSLPVLLALGLEPELANGTNRVAVLVGVIAALATFMRADVIRWNLVAPLAAAAVPGAIIGARLSEVIPPSKLHLAIVAALLIAVVLLLIRPTRWLATEDSDPHVGPVQLLLVFLVGIWAGFIVLDGLTYLLFVLVLSVGMDLITANAAKVAIGAAIAAVSLPVLAAGGHVDWVAAAPLSVGAVAGGVVAARLAVLPGAGKWIYRLIVVIVLGEVAQLALAGLRL
ncbi:MAG: sulfite exporter TauE/SafE family protein [Mycobacterium sp.]